MKYKFLIFLTLIFSVNSCDQSSINKLNNKNFKIEKKYQNSGFALIYNDKFKKIKKLEKRSLNVYHKSLLKFIL